MSKRKQPLIICAILTIIFVLELLPYGAVLNFANPDGEPFRATYSYFDPITFGYSNFGPFITAILTCILLIFAVINLIKPNSKLSFISFALSIVAFVASLMPLMFGINNYSVIGGAISALLLALCIYLKITKA